MKRNKTKLVKFLEIDEIKEFQRPLLERAKIAIGRKNKTIADRIAIRDFTLINLVYSCALRISEACNLTLNYLDLEKKTLYVIDGKGGDRTVPIPEPTLNNLKIWLKIRPNWEDNNYVFVNVKGTTRPTKDKNGVIKSTNVKSITAKYYNQLFNKLSDETGIKLKNGDKPHPHTLRHSRAMEIYDNGTDLEVLQTLLGHKEISTTQVYARVRDERLAKVQNNITAGIVSL